MTDAPDAAPTVAYVSLGCRVNRVETDDIIECLRQAGLAVGSERSAAAIVINTCAVTGEAESKARKAVRHAQALPQHPVVVATGCLASLNAEALQSLGDNIVVEVDKHHVTERVIDELELRGILPPVHRALPSLGVTGTGRTRPGVKVQDGCDLRCSYCIVWKARGPSRSMDLDEVVSQVRAWSARGAAEVMLTGINLGRYQVEGQRGTLRLPELLEVLLERTEVGRLRLGSIEPQDVDERLVSVMAASKGRVAPFIHLCLQSGSDATLRRMRRVYDTTLFAERVDLARGAMPAVALGTDLIVGFPGESAREFDDSLAFCERMRFSRMHVFRYSARPGTPAAAMKDQVDAVDMARRATSARELATRMRLEQARSRIGERDLVVVQSPGLGVSGGLFDAELPMGAPVGTLSPVLIRDVRDDATLCCALDCAPLS